MGWPGPMTHRQFLAWQQWLSEEWNHPSRTDHYLIALTAETRRSWVAKPQNVKDSEFRLVWEEPKPKDYYDKLPPFARPLTKEQASKMQAQLMQYQLTQATKSKAPAGSPQRLK